MQKILRIHVRARVDFFLSKKIYLCASVRNVGKTPDHGRVLALLCVPGLGACLHKRLNIFIPTALVLDLPVLRFEHLITSLLAPQRRYASPAWHGF